MAEASGGVAVRINGKGAVAMHWQGQGSIDWPEKTGAPGWDVCPNSWQHELWHGPYVGSTAAGPGHQLFVWMADVEWTQDV